MITDQLTLLLYFKILSKSNNHKAGYVSVIGNPNVGKSTFINKLMGHRLSIVSAKAQTTRHRILGILNHPNYQIIFSDTPGLINPKYNLQKKMMVSAKETLLDTDVMIYMVDCSKSVPYDKFFVDSLNDLDIPLLLLVNKIDLCNQTILEDIVIKWEKIMPKAKINAISALTGFYCNQILQHIVELLPYSSAYFPKDQITDRPERFFVNETIRKHILNYYHREIPYAVEVFTEEFIEEPDIIRLRSIVYVERESQKGIVIGHKGKALTIIGTKARKDLERFFNKKIFLKINVKIAKNWRKDPTMLKKFGYS